MKARPIRHGEYWLSSATRENMHSCSYVDAGCLIPCGCGMFTKWTIRGGLIADIVSV